MERFNVPPADGCGDSPSWPLGMRTTLCSSLPLALVLDIFSLVSSPCLISTVLGGALEFLAEDIEPVRFLERDAGQSASIGFDYDGVLRRHEIGPDGNRGSLASRLSQGELLGLMCELDGVLGELRTRSRRLLAAS